MTAPTFTKERAEACEQERKAQWDAYYAQQRAEKEKHDAAVAEQQAEDDAARGRQQREEAEHTRAALEARWANYRAMEAAENSPDNQCKQPDVARKVLEAWNSLTVFQEAGFQAIDINHLTTTKAADSVILSCHGIFLTNRGRSFIGSIKIKLNIAGDPIAMWTPDDSQDRTDYDAPPDLPPQLIEKTISDAHRTPPSVDGTDTRTSPSFSAGLADRRSLETWVASLTGDEQQGEKWWAANRNVKNHRECATAGMSANDEAAWLAGCLNAQKRLTPVDLKRTSDLDYKRGWNSY